MTINIYNRRKELNLTLEDVARAVGVSKGTVKKWESGYIKNMRRDKIISLAKILDISPLQILEMNSDADFCAKTVLLTDTLKKKYKELFKTDFDIDICSTSAVLIENNRLVLLDSKNPFF
ncbi:MAG: helix-turn-helix transcriptional regulator [Clostridia bacterium]|nr:helix-turn-helix transcriptional regulator [Clostridia bacterium]MBQ9737880.1 helix-turn-helix transcriptional regulator [Clostridia bacterium]